MANNRRGLLQAVGSFVCGGLVAGASSGVISYKMGKSDGRSEGYQDGIDTGIRRMGGIEPNTNDTKIRNESQEVTVQPGDHHAIHLTFAKETLFLYSVIASGDLDIVLMTKENYTEYQNDGETQFLTLYSDLDTSRAIRKQIIQSGEYVFVFDNTTIGRANPKKSVKIGYSVEAYQRDD